MNFTWWVNREDLNGNNLFAGGFLGLDNIGLFDRSKPIPGVGRLEQADATAWMAFYCTTMLAIALELSGRTGPTRTSPPSSSSTSPRLSRPRTSRGQGLWDEQDGFYYDHARVDGRVVPYASDPR